MNPIIGEIENGRFALVTFTQGNEPFINSGDTNRESHRISAAWGHVWGHQHITSIETQAVLVITTTGDVLYRAERSVLVTDAAIASIVFTGNRTFAEFPPL